MAISAKNHIHVKKITFRNFMSYGNNVNEFTFPDGLNWLCAANGCGKSTLVEALNFAFFGKSYRGGKREELRNTMNTEAVLEVTVEFSRTQGTTTEEYFIKRTVDPKNTMKFTVEKKEGDKWIPQNKRAGFTQKDFEDDILRFNEVLFKNNIAQNTQESLPFIDMEAADRRKLTDSIIMLDNDRIKKENAKELSTAKTNFEIANSDRNRIQDEITELRKIIAHMEDEKKANIAQMEATVAEKRTLVEQYKSQSGALATELRALQTRLVELKAVLDTEPSIDAAIAGIHNAKSQIVPLQQYRAELEKANVELTAAMNSYNALPIQAKNEELAGIDTQIRELNTAAQGIMTEINGLNSEKGKAEGVVQKWDYAIQQASTQLKQFADDGKKRKADLDHVDEQINLGAMMQAGTKCPTCGHTLTEADIEEHKGEIRQKLIDDINADVNRLREAWVQCKGKVTELEHSRADAAAALEKVIGDLSGANERYSAIEQQLATANTNRGTVYNEIQGYTSIYNSTVIPVQTKVEQLKRNISMCEQVIAGSDINVDEFVAEEARLTQEKERIAGARTDWRAAYDTYSTKNGEYSSLGGSITQMEAEISRIEGEITRIKEATSEDALAMTNKRLADAERDLEQATERWHTASKTIAACNYITGMLSDGGMKKMVYGLYIDHFNEVVRKNLLRANLPFVIEFDDTMNFKFISAPGYAPSYTMLSQGQRRKVGFAIAMAFRDFVSLVGNFSINFMSLDEVLDISTDNYAMREMLDIVRSMVSEIGCVVVITHRGDAVADKFDHKIVVEYDGTYSHMGDVTAV